MHANMSLLTSISVTLVAAFVGGLLVRRVGLPTIFGYLLAGMAIGPFTPLFAVSPEHISQLAEIGVIFLLFGVGLHFSLNDFWAVRRIAVPGALAQMILATGLGFGLTRFWGWSVEAGLVLGLAISIASTVILLRGLIDNGLLNTSAGQVAVGWLVMEDLATVCFLVILPALLSGPGDMAWLNVTVALLKAAFFVGMMLLAGARFLPWLLTSIAHTRSRELFILAAVAVALGTAFGATLFFGVSLALGAFLAGLVLGESEVSQRVGDEVLPFREIFAVIFFVSVGMLVNPLYLLAHAGEVLALALLIIVGKTLTTQLVGLILPASGHTMLVVSTGLSQIGEFSFIVGQTGVYLGVLSQDQYSLILAGSLLSILINPLLFRNLPWAERTLRRMPLVRQRFIRHQPPARTPALPRSGHVVVVGYGRVGEHIVTVLDRLGIPRLVVEIDARRAAEFNARGIATLFGDASNSDVLTHAGLDGARALVVTLPDETATELVVASAHQLAPALPVIARAATRSGVLRLSACGARWVIHPELEGGLEVVRNTLLCLGYPAIQVQSYTDAVRQDQYDTSVSSPAERQVLDQLLHTARGIAIAWRTVPAGSALVGQNLAQANLRARTGASVIALIRDQHMLANPKSSTIFAPGDLIGLIGESADVDAADRLIATAAPLALELTPA